MEHVQGWSIPGVGASPRGPIIPRGSEHLPGQSIPGVGASPRPGAFPGARASPRPGASPWGWSIPLAAAFPSRDPPPPPGKPRRSSRLQARLRFRSAISSSYKARQPEPCVPARKENKIKIKRKRRCLRMQGNRPEEEEELLLLTETAWGVELSSALPVPLPCSGSRTTPFKSPTALLVILGAAFLVARLELDTVRTQTWPFRASQPRGVCYYLSMNFNSTSLGAFPQEIQHLEFQKQENQRRLLPAP